MLSVWLWGRPWQCTWQTVGWSISFPKENDRGLPLQRVAPLCAYKSWEMGGLSINGRFGVRPEKSSSPISVSKSETQSAGHSARCSLTCTKTPVVWLSCKDLINLGVCSQTNTNAILYSVLYCFMWFKRTVRFCFALGQLEWLDAKTLITHNF